MQPANQERQFLSRHEITSILNERHLNIPSIELLPYSELLRIYKTFVVPLDRRESKRIHVIPIPDPEQFKGPPNAPRTIKEDIIAHTVVQTEHLKTYFDPHLLQQTKYLKLSFNTIANSARKRESTIALNGFEEATLPKRKPVTWP